MVLQNVYKAAFLIIFSLHSKHLGRKGVGGVGVPSNTSRLLI